MYNRCTPWATTAMSLLLATAANAASTTTEKEIFVPMRDGIHLSTDIQFPDGDRKNLPTVLIRTPYDKDRIEGPGIRAFTDGYLKHGYAVVLQSERGRFFSEGSYDNYLQGAAHDGYDTVDWITHQPWSNGKVGTLGCSSSSEQQWPMAASNPPGFAAMIPMAGGMAVGSIPGNDTHGSMYRGGVPVLDIWAWWYADFAQRERLLLPADSTQQQRIRLRNSYSLLPTPNIHVDAITGQPEPGQLMHLPLKDFLRVADGALSPMDQYLTWGPGDIRWHDVEQLSAPTAPHVPALLVDTWHNELGVVEATRLFKYLQDAHTPNQYLIIGAGPHCAISSDERHDDTPRLDLADLKFGDLEIGDARYHGVDHGFAQLYQDWFDHWLTGKDNHVTDMPKVQLFVMGQGWISSDRWPLPDTRFTNYYLDAESQSLTTAAPTRDHSQTYRYDPASPTPSLGGGCCGKPAALDQRPVEARKDVLVYTTSPLDHDLTIGGPIDVELYVSSSTKDTDFMVRIVDVYADGKAINLADDAFRVRYRDGLDKPRLMQAHQVYKIDLTNLVTAIRFPKGHRIRLDVSSSSFPMYARNLNTGGNNYDETEALIADNTVHGGGRYPSRIVLPVLPD